MDYQSTFFLVIAEPSVEYKGVQFSDYQEWQSHF